MIKKHKKLLSEARRIGWHILAAAVIYFTSSLVAANAQYSVTGAFSDLTTVSGSNQLISYFTDSSTSAYQKIYVGTGVNTVDYASLYSGTIPTVVPISDYPIGVSFQSTGYRYFTAAFRTPGVYTITVTSSPSADSMAAIYVSTDGAIPYDSTNALKNIYSFNDDGPGTPVGHDPWTIYYKQTTASCTLIQVLIYKYSASGSGMNGSYSASGPGNSVASCSAFGPNASKTELALEANHQALRALMDSRANSIAVMMDYDCATFDRNNFCMSFQALYSKMSDMNEGGGVLTVAYRFGQNFRVGGFIDYRPVQKDPVGLKTGDEKPSIGLFVGYSENDIGTGLQAKATIAHNRNSLTVSRALFGDEGDTELGSGRSNVSSFGVAGEMGWGFAVGETLTATPYLGIRHINVVRDAYAEALVTGSVEYPITYDAYYQRMTSATTGVRFAGTFTDKFGYRFSFGGEYDFVHKASAYAGQSTISGLEAFALASRGHSDRVRGVAGAGVYYQMDKTQRLIANVALRGQAFGSQASVTTMVGYQAAF